MSIIRPNDTTAALISFMRDVPHDTLPPPLVDHAFLQAADPTASWGPLRSELEEVKDLVVHNTSVLSATADAKLEAFIAKARNLLFAVKDDRDMGTLQQLAAHAFPYVVNGTPDIPGSPTFGRGVVWNYTRVPAIKVEEVAAVQALIRESTHPKLEVALTKEAKAIPDTQQEAYWNLFLQWLYSRYGVRPTNRSPSQTWLDTLWNDLNAS